MIAVVVHTYIYRFTVKKFLNLKPGVRILFFFFFLLPVAQVAVAQSAYVDSMIRWVSAHPRDDSAKIRTLHKISYLLSETDTKESFAYYEQVSRLSDSLHFTFGKSLAQINLGILLS